MTRFLKCARGFSDGEVVMLENGKIYEVEEYTNNGYVKLKNNHTLFDVRFFVDAPLWCVFIQLVKLKLIDFIKK